MLGSVCRREPAAAADGREADLAAGRDVAGQGGRAGEDCAMAAGRCALVARAGRLPCCARGAGRQKAKFLFGAPGPAKFWGFRDSKPTLC